MFSRAEQGAPIARIPCTLCWRRCTRRQCRQDALCGHLFETFMYQCSTMAMQDKGLVSQQAVWHYLPATTAANCRPASVHAKEAQFTDGSRKSREGKGCSSGTINQGGAKNTN